MVKDNSFEYGGKHFIPVRKFNEKDGDFHKIVRNLKTDKVLGFYAADYHGRQRFEYSYDDFYKACGSMNCDIFKCVENGKVYVPCAYELQLYEPKVKDREER